MTLYMVLAAVYGVLQLAVLGWLAGRSVRVGTALLAVVVGVYGCGMAALILQAIYTRGVAQISGETLGDVVRVASYTVDPFLEEIVKVVPLLLVGMHVRSRFQLGLTDYLVLGAALGAGFGLLEAILRFSHRGADALPVPDGWIIASESSAALVPDAGAIVGAWLPAPASSQVAALLAQPQTFAHLAWGAVAGLGVGAMLRGKGVARLLGPAALVFAAADHAALNYHLYAPGGSGFGTALAAPFAAAHRVVWLYPLIGLAVAAFFDQRDVARLGKTLPAAPAAFALHGLPWTLLVALRFGRLRRSLAYARARGPESATASLYHALATIRWLIDRANSQAAWQRTPALLGLPTLTALRAALRDWRVWVWLALLAPAFLFFIAGGFPATRSVQAVLTSPAVSWLLVCCLAVGLGWLLWQATVHLRQLPKALGQPHAEVSLRSRLQLMSAAGAVVGGLFGLYLVGSGSTLSQQAITAYHAIAALAGAIVAVVVLLAVAALCVMFPLGALALHQAGPATGGLSSTLLAEATLVGPVTGVVLMQAADSGGGPAGPDLAPESPGSRPRGPNEEQYPEGDFDGTGSSVDQIADLAYRHSGGGDLHTGGAARPARGEIVATLAYGERSEPDGHHAVHYARNGVKVIVNRDMLWRSTAYYL